MFIFLNTSHQYISTLFYYNLFLHSIMCAGIRVMIMIMFILSKDIFLYEHPIK